MKGLSFMIFTNRANNKGLSFLRRDDDYLVIEKNPGTMEFISRLKDPSHPEIYSYNDPFTTSPMMLSFGRVVQDWSSYEVFRINPTSSKGGMTNGGAEVYSFTVDRNFRTLESLLRDMQEHYMSNVIIATLLSMVTRLEDLKDTKIVSFTKLIDKLKIRAYLSDIITCIHQANYSMIIRRPINLLINRGYVILSAEADRQYKHVAGSLIAAEQYWVLKEYTKAYMKDHKDHPEIQEAFRSLERSPEVVEALVGLVDFDIGRYLLQYDESNDGELSTIGEFDKIPDALNYLITSYRLLAFDLVGTSSMVELNNKYGYEKFAIYDKNERRYINSLI